MKGITIIAVVGIVFGMDIGVETGIRIGNGDCTGIDICVEMRYRSVLLQDGHAVHQVLLQDGHAVHHHFMGYACHDEWTLPRFLPFLCRQVTLRNGGLMTNGSTGMAS